MTKSDLLRAVSKETGLPNTDIAAVLESVAQQVRGRLYQGEDVTLPGLGKIGTKLRQARAGRSPRDGAEIQIPARTVVVFKAEASLRNVLSDAHRHDGVSE